MKQSIVYLRTSTTEQTPQIQFAGCKEVLTRLEVVEYDKLEEQKSAYKNDDERTVFNEIKTNIKRGHVKKIIVWDLDRLYRNRLKLVAFMELCKMYKCKVYSYRQKWLDEINTMPEPWDDIMFTLMINIMGWMAEDESKKKSARVKNAIRVVCPSCKKRNDRSSKRCVSCKADISLVPAKSYTGKKWGRKAISNEKMTADIIRLNKEQPNLTYKEISMLVYYYKGTNKKNPSVNTVFKTLKQHKESLK